MDGLGDPIPQFGNVIRPSGLKTQVRRNAVGNAGTIKINTNVLSTGAVNILADTAEQGDAGEILINARDRVNIDGESLLLTQVQSGAIGEGGNIKITTGSLQVQNGSLILGDTKGTGDAGDINVHANERILLDGSVFSSKLNDLSSSNFDAIGDAGDITVTTQKLTITNEANLSATSSGEGDSGNIVINARDSILIEDGTVLQTQMQPGGIGDGGNLEIKTKDLTVADSYLLADSKGKGDSGQIIINATNSISLEDIPELFEGSQIVSGTGLLGDETQGDAGDIKITTKSLSLQGESLIAAQTNGMGNGGDIFIDAKEKVVINDSSRILSQVLKDAEGSGGEINITSPIILLNDFSLISTNTQEGGVGQAGNINLDTNLLSLIDKSSIDALTENDSDGGTIHVKARREINLSDQAQISVDSQGQGSAGTLSIEANSLTLQDSSSLLASTPSGKGGTINLQLTEDLILRDNSLISARAFQEAVGGNIDIDAEFIIAFPSQPPENGNDIIANSELGKGGNINIKEMACNACPTRF